MSLFSLPSYCLCPCALALVLLMAAVPARAAPGVAGEALLNLAVSSTTVIVPGEYRETRMTTERSLRLSPGFAWETSTGFTGTRYSSLLPASDQSVRVTTGPQLRLGNAQLSAPLQAGYEVAGGSSADWITSTPRLTLALGPSDVVRLEARVHRRAPAQSAGARKSKKSVGMNWRHQFDERYALLTGLERRRSIDEFGVIDSDGAEVYAQISAQLPDRWRLQLNGSVYGGGIPTGTGETMALARDRATSIGLTATRELGSGWRLSGAFSLDQRQSSPSAAPVVIQSGRLRLMREF